MGATVLVLTVEGMTCNGCRGGVEKALQAVDGVESASVDLESKLATVSGTASAASLIAAVKAMGKTAILQEPAMLVAPEMQAAIDSALKKAMATAAVAHPSPSLTKDEAPAPAAEAPASNESQTVHPVGELQKQQSESVPMCQLPSCVVS